MTRQEHLRIVDEVRREADRERRMLEIALGDAYGLLCEIAAAPILHTAPGRYREIQIPAGVLDEVRAFVARMKEGL